MDKGRSDNLGHCRSSQQLGTARVDGRAKCGERERFRMRGAQASLVKTRPDKSPVALRGPRVVRLAGAA